MGKLTGGLLFLVVMLCAVTAQSAEPLDVFGISSEPTAMTIVLCSSNSDCATGVECVSGRVCIDDVTSMPTSASCTTDDDCDVGSSCQETSICSDVDGPCTTDADCAGNPDGELCNVSSGQCVECLRDDTCAEGSYCDRGACTPFSDCALSIRPTRIRISGRGKKPFIIRLLRIKGNENFAPEGSGNECAFDSDCAAGERCRFDKTCQLVFDIDPLAIANPNGIEVRKGLLKVRIAAPTDADLGPVQLRIGKCLGEVDLE